MDYYEAKRIVEQASEGYKSAPNTLKGSNFMTPDCIRTIKVNDRYNAELSIGTGIFNDYIYGITVFKPGSKKSEHELSICVHSGEEITEHLNSLKG